VHPEKLSGRSSIIIALGQACLTQDLFIGGLPEKKVYLGGMRILSILLNIESGCHMLAGQNRKEKRK
jgi:hypothetical protein